MAIVPKEFYKATKQQSRSKSKKRLTDVVKNHPLLPPPTIPKFFPTSLPDFAAIERRIPFVEFKTTKTIEEALFKGTTITRIEEVLPKETTITGTITGVFTSTAVFEELFEERGESMLMKMREMREKIDERTLYKLLYGGFDTAVEDYPTIWATTYSLPVVKGAYRSGKYSTTLHARDRGEAEYFCKLRGLGETVDGNLSQGQPYRVPTLTSDWLKKRQWHKAQHSMTWLSMIASKAGVIDPFDLICDNGLLHEIAHVCESAVSGRSDEVTYFHVLHNVEQLEKEVPGMWPVTGVMDRVVKGADEKIA